MKRISYDTENKKFITIDLDTSMIEAIYDAMKGRTDSWKLEMRDGIGGCTMILDHTGNIAIMQSGEFHIVLHKCNLYRNAKPSYLLPYSTWTLLTSMAPERRVILVQEIRDIMHVTLQAASQLADYIQAVDQKNVTIKIDGPSVIIRWTNLEAAHV